jgi:hypothetical protein
MAVSKEVPSSLPILVQFTEKGAAFSPAGMALKRHKNNLFVLSYRSRVNKLS